MHKYIPLLILAALLGGYLVACSGSDEAPQATAPAGQSADETAPDEGGSGGGSDKWDELKWNEDNWG